MNPGTTNCPREVVRRGARRDADGLGGARGGDASAAHHERGILRHARGDRIDEAGPGEDAQPVPAPAPPGARRELARGRRPGRPHTRSTQQCESQPEHYRMPPELSRPFLFVDLFLDSGQRGVTITIPYLQ